MRDEKRFKLQKAYTPSGSSLVAQMVKHLPTVPTMWETGVQSLGREDPLEKEMAAYSSTLIWEISWTGAWQATVHGVEKEWVTT